MVNYQCVWSINQDVEALKVRRAALVPMHRGCQGSKDLQVMYANLHIVSVFFASNIMWRDVSAQYLFTGRSGHQTSC